MTKLRSKTLTWWSSSARFGLFLYFNFSKHHSWFLCSGFMEFFQFCLLVHVCLFIYHVISHIKALIHATFSTWTAILPIFCLANSNYIFQIIKLFLWEVFMNPLDWVESSYYPLQQFSTSYFQTYGNLFFFVTFQIEV